MNKDITFDDLTLDEKKDYLDLMTILSANVNELYSKSDRPDRTEDEILDTCSDNVKKAWENLLFSKLKDGKITKKKE